MLFISSHKQLWFVNVIPNYLNSSPTITQQVLYLKDSITKQYLLIMKCSFYDTNIITVNTFSATVVTFDSSAQMRVYASPCVHNILKYHIRYGLWAHKHL